MINTPNEQSEQSASGSFPSSSSSNNDNNDDNNIKFNPTRGELLILKENPQKIKKERTRRQLRNNAHHGSLVQKNIVHEIVNEEQEEEKKKTFVEMLDKFISVGKRSFYLQAFISIISTLNFIHYVVCTYEPSLFDSLRYCEIFLNLVYFLEYLMNIMLAHHRISYILSLNSLINLVTMVPSFFSFIPNDPLHDDLYMVINCTRVIRVLRIFHIFYLDKTEDNDNRRLMMIINSLVQLILISAGITQIVEQSAIEKKIALATNQLLKNNLKMRTKFHHYIYFTVVTVSTVGYGDIYPFTSFGKLVIISLVILIIVLIPYQTNDLIQIMRAQSEYAKYTYKASKDIPHIILTGDISIDSLRSFCKELFHPDHGAQYRHAVIVSTQLPSREMEIFLNEKTNKNFIFYLQGNPLQEKDLLRADAHKAKACIIFNNKNSNDPYSGDHQSLFLGIFIKKFVYNYNLELARGANNISEVLAYSNPSFHLCMQLNKPESSRHYFNTLQQMYRKRMKQDQLIVIESIKMNLLSKSCLTPGIMALITNLVMSSGDLNDSNEAEWLKEYSEGRGHEIYRIQLQAYYKDMNFLEIVENVYNQAQAIVFALEVEVSGVSIVKLNPTNNMKLCDMITKAKDINSTDKTKESRGGMGKDNNSINSEIISYTKNKTPGPNPMENKVRIFAYLICSDKSVADEISNKEKDKPEPIKSSQAEQTNKVIGNLIGGLPELIQNSLNPHHISSSFHPAKGDTQNVSGVGGGFSDSDSDNEVEMDKEDIIQFGSTGLSFNKNDYHFNYNPEHFLKNNIEIMHHSIKDREDITNHIIICGLHPALVHFILPLRAKYLQEDALKWIVILAPNLPQHLFDTFTKFNRIIFIQGSPLLPENLFRANILNADKAVILSSGESKMIKSLLQKNNKNQAYSEEEMLDAETIFIYKAIKKCNKNIQIMTELICTRNIEYLLNTSNLQQLFHKQDESPQYEFTPLYASGEVFTPSIIDSITCQSYYNPHIVTIIELILGGEKALTTKKSKKLDDFFKLGGSNLYLVKIPDTYVNESFGEFFYFLIHHHHSIGIALYRKNIIEGYYYVYTNPKKTTLLRDCDFVFVLANSSNILDLIDERPVIEGLNEGNFNSIRSSSEVESLIEDEEEEGNIKNKTELPQRQDKRKPTTKQSSRKSTRKESKLLMNTEGFVNKLEKKKKQMESSKHKEIEKMRSRIKSINDNITEIKNSFVDIPQYIDQVIDEEFDNEVMIYLMKN